jgi:hypothetical protein
MYDKKKFTKEEIERFTEEELSNMDSYLDEITSIPSASDFMHPEDTAYIQGEMDELERMEYEYNLIEWEKQYSY